MTEDETVGWHHPLNGHELEQAPGVGDGQGGLGCHAPWGRSESDTTHHLRVLYNQAILPGGHEHKKLLTTVECVEVCVCAHLPPHPIPLGFPSAPALSALFHALNLNWSSISHMVIYRW